jgi:small subunit ribosomal protein S7
MPRKGPAIKRPLVTDPVYGSPLVTALVSKVLLAGKRSLARWRAAGRSPATTQW